MDHRLQLLKLFANDIASKRIIRITSFVILFLILVISFFFVAGHQMAGDLEKASVEYNFNGLSNTTPLIPDEDNFTNHVGMVFVPISPGSFLMGSPSGEQGRTIFEVQNEILIEKPFYIQTTEVTQRQWREVMGDNPSYFNDCGEDCPVENISWADTQNFIKKLNQMDSFNNYRLPTEAEWEYVCRSGSTTAFSIGDFIDFKCRKENILYEIAWYNCNSQGKTHPVGQKLPNDWGVYDMYGNVYEWCQDIYVTDYAQILNGASKATDPSAERVGRSCSFDDTAVSCRSAARVNFKPNTRSNAIGFRLVRESKYYKIEIPPAIKTTKRIPAETEQKLEAATPGDKNNHQEKLSESRQFAVQIASTKSIENARRLVTQLTAQGYPAYHVKAKIDDKGIWFRIRIGEFNSVSEAESLRKELTQKSIQGIVVLK